MKKFLSLLMIVVMFLTISSFSINAFAQQNNLNQEYYFKGATLDIGTTLSINYYAKADAGYKAQFTMNGKTQVVDAEYDSKMGLYKFAFTGINPQCMNDIVDAKLLDANGQEIDSYNGYSVRQYCNNMASTTAKENNFTQVQHNAMLTLLADTLNYGAEAQLYQKYKTNTLANSEPWVMQNESSFKIPQGIKEIKGNQDTDGQIKSASLSISNTNNIYFRLGLNSENVVITLNNKVIDRSQLKLDDDGTYLLYTEDLTATQFDKEFKLVLSKNGQEISSVRYNLKAFVQSKHSSESVGGISKALSNYGDSAVYYIKAISKDLDLDFDLGYGELLTDNVIPELASTFDYAISPEAVDWFVPAGWNTTMSLVDDDKGGKALAFTIGQSYESAMFNIAPYVKPGTYTVSFRYKVDGNRPLIYADNVADSRYTAHIVNKFRNKCMEAGLGNPYIIGLEQFGATPENVKELGFDALGDYAAGGGVDAGEFKDLAHDIWLQWYEWKTKGIQIVPLVSTGWDRRPRIDNPVTWEGPTKNKLDFTNTATPQEIADHLKQALDFNKNNPDLTTANTVLIYAWNEHDEGGWLCPTLLDDDGDGIPTKRSDGTNARDTRRLQAIQKVLRPDAVWSLDKDVALENDYVVPNYQTVPPTSEATQTPTSTEAPANNNDNGSNYTFIIIGACIGVVVLLGLTATIVILSKKKKTKENDEK